MAWENENFYESEITYSNNRVAFQSSPLPPAPPEITSKEDPPKRSWKLPWRIATIALALVTVGLLSLVIGLVINQNVSNTENGGTPAPTNQPGTGENAGKSCKALKQKGASLSGIYKIKLEEASTETETYCDMETDGGGWTLVASVHESDIRRKCYSDDLWSSYVPLEQISYTGSSNWENEMTFGSVHKCTEDDYKSSAYFKLNASDLMIWHVQSGVLPSTMKSLTNYRYRTTDQFLARYGGNLKSLFTEHYPLTVKTESKYAKVLDALVKKASTIKAQIPNWHEYAVGSGSNSIRDTEMFSSNGNYINFHSATRSWGYLNYGREYSLHKPYALIKTTTSSPFTMATVIMNERNVIQYYRIQSYSTRRVTDVITKFENMTTRGNYKLEYRAAQFYNPSYPSPCLFYFVVSNVEEWKSNPPSTFGIDWEYQSGNSRYIRYRIDGNPSHIVFGYILLARQAGYNVNSEQLDKVASVTLEAIASTQNLFRAPTLDDTLTVPVTFDKGSTSEMLNTIPPDFRTSVQPGYLQFRAYNHTGYPNAICPGVKVDTGSPEYVCVGGVSADLEEYGTCGDYAGWAGNPGDTASGAQASGSAHSNKDIIASMLIFYR